LIRKYRKRDLTQALKKYKEVKKEKNNRQIGGSNDVKREIEGISKKLDRSVDRATSLHDRTSTSRLLSKNLLKDRGADRVITEERKEFQLGQYIANHSVVEERQSEHNLLA
jgi:hypothetical protein